MLIDVTTALPFIEDWAFTRQGVVAKSRARHGTAKIELFSLRDGQLLAMVDAHADNLPEWAKPFAE